jgi:hypothetical protein
MIKKRLIKIRKIITLIIVRQFWKLGENIYHLLNQPFLTIKKLWDEKDKSQIFLLSLTIIMPIFGYASARVIWDLKKYGFLVNSVGTIFTIVMLIESSIFIYLGYWIFKVWKRKFN